MHLVHLRFYVCPVRFFDNSCMVLANQISFALRNIITIDAAASITITQNDFINFN